MSLLGALILVDILGIGFNRTEVAFEALAKLLAYTEDVAHSWFFSVGWAGINTRKEEVVLVPRPGSRSTAPAAARDLVGATTRSGLQIRFRRPWQCPWRISS